MTTSDSDETKVTSNYATMRFHRLKGVLMEYATDLAARRDVELALRTIQIEDRRIEATLDKLRSDIAF